MKSIKAYLMVWFAGLVAGFILMERWQRTSGLQAPTAADGGETGEMDAAAKVPADQPNVATVVVAGAKADAERARQLLERVSPWGSSSPLSPAKLRRAGRTATPETTPADSA